MTTVDHEAGRHSVPEQHEPPSAESVPATGPERTPTGGPSDGRLLLIGACILAAVILLAVGVVIVRHVADGFHHGATSTSHDKHKVAGVAHGRDEATLDLVSGVTSVTVKTADLTGDMYRVSTPDGGSQLPAVVDSGDRVQVQLTDSGEKGASSVLIELSSHVAWHIRLGGGSSEASLDLRAGGLASLDFASGISSIEASLPKPHGTVTVRLAGGASTWTLHLPKGVPAQLTVGGGAGSATVDGTVHNGISGGQVFSTDGYASAGDRYDLEATSGVSTIVVDRQ